MVVFSPQNSTLTIEEFHSKLQEATNFPLRPFVIPFLKVTANPAPSCQGLPQEPHVHSLPDLSWSVWVPPPHPSPISTGIGALASCSAIQYSGNSSD